MPDLDEYGVSRTPPSLREWGVRYLDGVTMARFDRATAEQSVAEHPGRAVMYRINRGPWREVSQS